MSIQTISRIMVVDDEIELAAALCDSLKVQGYDTVGFPSGKDALELLKCRSFDLLLTDLMMPEMDGISLLQAAMKIDPQMVGIIMTGQGTVQTAVEAMKLGAFDYILKPFKLQMLMPTLTRALEFRRLRMENIQLRETMAIYELCQIIAHTLELDTVINKAADAALQQMEADEVSILLPTQDGNELYIAVVRGEQREGILGNRVSFSQGIAGWVARNQTTVMLDGQVDDERFTPLYPRPEIHSSISMPMLAGGRLAGVLNVNSTKGRTFTVGQVKGMSILTSTIAAALESAGLYRELQSAEERYRSIFENAVYGIFQSSPEGRFLAANPALARILGYDSPKELVASVTDIQTMIYADPQERVRYLKEMNERGFASGFETQFLKKDGSRTWVSLNARCVSDSTGRLLYFEGDATDINDHKIMGEKLRHAEHQNELILNCAGDGIYGMDTEGRFLFVNPAAAGMLGYNVGELIGKPCHALIHHTGLDGNPSPEVECMIIRVFTDCVDLRETNDVFWRKDGSSFPVEYTATAIMEEGRIWGAVVTFKDISERKKAEDALRESEERFRQIAESAKAWIWEVNGEGLYTYSSQAVEEIMGYMPEEIIGKKHFYDFFPADIREQIKKEALEPFAAKRAFVKYVNSNVHKNGSIVLLETNGVPILDSRGDLLGYRGVNVDITEYRKIEDQLRHAQKMEAVGTLAGGIAHDFNNILNVIMGYSTMVLDRIKDDQLSREQMNEVLAAAGRAATLTKRLLVFSRNQLVDVNPVNINELIHGLQKMLVRIIRENIEFNLDLADSLLIVLADAGQIEQVLMNLVGNAKDAMLEGGRLTIGTGLEVVDAEYAAAYGYGKPGKYALITVADTGHGMDEETQKKIFEPFFTTKGVGEGTGLGLAISYGIIKQHSGYIKVYSEPGQGTVFKIYLPLSEKAALLDKMSEAAVPVKGGNETVLVAEDNAALRKLSRKVLESYGYSVITAEDGEDAITKFMENRERISLVLLDMIMPKKSGKEVGEAIRKVSPRIKILFSSGYSMDIIKTKESAEGSVDFIHKPFLPKELLMKVREILDR